MTSTVWTRWTRKELALILAMGIFVFAVAFLLANLAHPKPFPAADLGAEWQCSKTLLLTTCTKTLPGEAVLRPSYGNAVCLRRA